MVAGAPCLRGAPHLKRYLTTYLCSSVSICGWLFPSVDEMLRTGVDLIEIQRVRTAVERFGDRFLARVYTPGELAVCNQRVESLAARFAAKEAVAKALGTGVWRSGIGWTDIEVLREVKTGAPTLTLHGAARTRAVELGLCQWSLSLSHDRSQAIALVVATD